MTVLDHPTRRRNTAKPRRSTTKRSAPARKHTNAPTKTALLKELDGLVRGIERSAINPTWKLADWLVENTDDPGHGGDRTKRVRTRLTIQEAADASGYSERWFQEMRATAQRFSKDIRIKGSSVRAHLLADRKYKSDVDAACKALRRGPKVSDQGRAKPSVAATRRVPVISQRDQANGAADENNDDKPGKRESDIQTLLEILWVDLDEANALAATLHGLDEDQSSVLRERADELRGAADLLDGIPKAGRA